MMPATRTAILHAPRCSCEPCNCHRFRVWYWWITGRHLPQDQTTPIARAALARAGWRPGWAA